jgi:signal peptidase I
MASSPKAAQRRKASRVEESAAQTAEAERSWRKSALRENFESIAGAVLFAIFVRGFIAQPYKIPSGSMEETLLVGDHLVVNKVVLGDGAQDDGPVVLPTDRIRRGDVVIFRPPHEEGTDYIKRVIGLPGEELKLIYQPSRNGVRVSVDGQPLPESYRLKAGGSVVEEPGAKWTVDYDGMPPETDPKHRWYARTVKLGPDEYFMMGDNRNNSQDSRFWGPVKAERVRGRAWFVYWSFENDGEQEPQGGLLRRIGFYARIALRFFPDSRWERTFRPIR